MGAERIARLMSRAQVVVDASNNDEVYSMQGTCEDLESVMDEFGAMD